MTLTVKLDLGHVKSQLDDITMRQVPYVTSLALNETAKAVVAAERETMGQVFDRPVEWTLNSLAVAPSNKAQGNIVWAEVRWREFAGKGVPAWKYLQPEIEGGFRRRKSHELRLIQAGVMRTNEFAVPGAGVQLDMHGNMPPALITQILSQVKATSDPFMAATPRSRAKHAAAGGAVYFARRQRGAPPGIYQRLAGRRIIPVIMFVRAPSYSERLDAYGRAREVANAAMRANFDRIWIEQSASFRR
jgi:hypothetical protein